MIIDGCLQNTKEMVAQEKGPVSLIIELDPKCSELRLKNCHWRQNLSKAINHKEMQEKEHLLDSDSVSRRCSLDRLTET